MKNWRRWLFWGVLLVALAGGLAYAFRPQPIAVDLAEVKRGPLVVTVDEEGKTRVKQAYVVSASVAGHARRITLEVGDAVTANVTKVAEIEPIDPSFLDIRTRAQAEAAVRSAEAAKVLAAAELKAAEAELVFARTELDRARQLYEKEAGSKRALDAAERAFRTRQAAVQTAKARLNMRDFELRRARLQLVTPADRSKRRGACDCIAVRSPVNGRVLQIFHKSAGVVRAGERLIEVGDPRNLEVVVDLLSSDAVKVRPGQRVMIERWGGPRPLAGKVMLVEPLGQTKVSALGIEEQRVNVVIALTDPPKVWQRLGHGFRVETRIVLWESKRELVVPLSALFRTGKAWTVFVAVDGEARRRTVQIGRRTALLAQVLGGLKAGERVVLHPDNKVTDGVGVVSRD